MDHSFFELGLPCLPILFHNETGETASQQVTRYKVDLTMSNSQNVMVTETRAQYALPQTSLKTKLEKLQKADQNKKAKNMSEISRQHPGISRMDHSFQ